MQNTSFLEIYFVYFVLHHKLENEKVSQFSLYRAWDNVKLQTLYNDFTQLSENIFKFIT